MKDDATNIAAVIVTAAVLYIFYDTLPKMVAFAKKVLDVSPSIKYDFVLIGLFTLVLIAAFLFFGRENA